MGLMGSGSTKSSRRGHEKFTEDTVNKDDNASTASASVNSSATSSKNVNVQNKQLQNTGLKESQEIMEPVSKSKENLRFSESPSIAKHFTVAKDNIERLKQCLQGNNQLLGTEQTVSTAMELLTFSCQIEDTEKESNAASEFLISQGFARVIVRIFSAFKNEFPRGCIFDRENSSSSGTPTLQLAQDVVNYLAGSTVNLTDPVVFAEECGKEGLVPLFVEMADSLKNSIIDIQPYEDPDTKTIKQFTVRGRLLSRILGTLVNLSKPITNRKFFMKCNAVEILLPLMKAPVTAYAIKSLFCLAYLLDENNSSIILSDTEPIKFIISMLDKAIKSPSRDYLGFSAFDLADGIAQLAVNSCNNTSKQIGLNGGIPSIVKMLDSSHDEREQLSGSRALWMLSFESTNREILLSMPEALNILKQLQGTEDKDISKHASGALWGITRNVERTSKSPVPVPSPHSHVMLSYQWDHQDAVLRVRDGLRAAGYSVWIDVEQMEGSTLEAMAKAVENAAVVVVCISQKYKESPNCRSEAEYSFQLRKEIIPLMMENQYKPDGWLGIIVGAKLWMDFRKEERINGSIQSLMKELGNRGRTKDVIAKTVTRKSVPPPDDLKEALLRYKKNHRPTYVYISECEKIIRGLRTCLASGQIASHAAFWRAGELSGLSLHKNVGEHSEDSRVVVNFLLDVEVPKLLVDYLRILKERFPEAAVYDREKDTKTVGEEVKWAQDVMCSVSCAILNFTDLHDGFCSACAEMGAIPLLIDLTTKLRTAIPDTKENTNFSGRGEVLRHVLGSLHNLARRPDSKKHFESCDGVQVLISLLKSEVTYFAMNSLLCLAYLVDERNNDLIMADEEPIKFLLRMLSEAMKSSNRRHLGFSASEIASGIGHVATNDKNKKLIGHQGGITVLVTLAKDATNDIERLEAIRALYMLSFHEDNKNLIRDDVTAMELLRSLTTSENKDIQKAAAGAMWEIEEKKGRTSHEDSQHHIMFSYQWDSQDIMLTIKDKLKAEGLKVWMDIEQMGGSTLEAMARAVENSSLVIIAMSQKYQDSPNCRSEAEYAYQCRKNIIPLMMEADYRPDGWLGIILGAKLWMDFRTSKDIGIVQLLKEIQNDKIGKVVKKRVVEEVSATSVESCGRPAVSQWSKDDVTKWLKDIGFESSSNVVRKSLDGSMLILLHKLRQESPDFFYNSIKTDMELPTVLEVLKFSEELRKLVG